jgi:hypothetical protein
MYAALAGIFLKKNCAVAGDKNKLAARLAASRPVS